MFDTLSDWTPGLVQGNTVDEHCRELLSNLRRFYDVITYEGTWLSEQGATETKASLEAVGVHHQLLRYWCQEGPEFV